MKTINTINSLAIFEKVASTKSFTKAAKEFEISKAHVSKTISELEAELKCQLFNRSTRTVELTETGENLLLNCKNPLQQLEQAKLSVLNSSQELKGKIKVSLAGLFGEQHIAPIIIQFMKNYPQVEVEMSFSEEIVNLIEEKVDLAIRVGALKDSNLITRQIATRREFVCATPEFVHKHGRPLHPKELAKFNCLQGSPQSWSFKVSKKLFNIKPSGNFKSNNARSVLSATLGSLGICKLPDVYVDKYIRNGQLISLLDQYVQDSVPIWAITLEREKSPLILKLLIKEIEQELKKGKREV